MSKVLIGTLSCEILEFKISPSLQSPSTITTTINSNNINISKGELLICGHYKDEVWGLATRPITEENSRISSGGSVKGVNGTRSAVEYCTVGDDGYLRVWNLLEHRYYMSNNSSDADNYDD